MASCTSTSTKQQQAAMQAQQYTIDSMKMVMAHQRAMDSMKQAAETQALALQRRQDSLDKAQALAATRTRTSRSTAARLSTAPRPVYYTSQASTYQGAAHTPAPAAPERRGWSAKAKGALIGAGVGAASGAIINTRNRAAGAAIGTVIGAGAGTGVGAVIDKRNGR